MWRSGAARVPGRSRAFGPAAWPPAPLRRGALLVALVALAAPLAGCATKKDLKLLRSEVVGLQARQDSLFLLLREQNHEILDSLRANSELTLRVRGDLGHQLLQMDQQLVQIQELTGQSQRRLAELRQQWESRNQQLAQIPAEPGEPEPARGGDADQLYQIGVEKLQQGAAGTARAAFQNVLQQYPTHEKAPDAQFQIAETYVLEKNYDAALRDFERVIELFPSAPRAPTALYRAGVLSEERGNIPKAREYFTRVRSGYPQSDEARLAAQKLERLRRR